MKTDNLNKQYEEHDSGQYIPSGVVCANVNIIN